MEMEEEELGLNILRDSTHTKTGIKVIQIDSLTETYTSDGKLIHVIEEEYPDILIHRWFGQVRKEEMQEVLDGHYLDQVKRGKFIKILADFSHMEDIHHQLNEWYTTYFTSKLISIGVKYRASVFSKSAIPLPNAKPGNGPSTFTERIFISEDEAVYWLQMVK